jgi:capsular exopolysaccharide synthesis family protein
MSLIFDALQRSESERSGIDPSTLSAATEVLELAELHAVSERNVATKSQRQGAARSAAHDTSSAVQPIAPTAVAAHYPPQAELPLIDKNLDDVFAQFQSHVVVVPAKNRLVCFTDSESLAAENFRFLGIRLQHLRRERPLKKVLITSTIPQEGKSMVSANLACSFARRMHQRILLVEGDLRRPTLSQMFGLRTLPGISECLQGEGNLMKSIYHLEGPDLWLLPAGNAPKNSLELLQSGRLSVMIEQLTAWFDWIIIDSPPVMPLADTSVWMRLADGILLVVREGTTEKRQLVRGLEALEPKKVIGALMNGSKRSTASDHYYSKVSSTASKPDDGSKE